MKSAFRKLHNWIRANAGLPSVEDTEKYCRDWDYAQSNWQACLDADPYRERAQIAAEMLDADPGSAFPVILELAELGSISSMDRVARCYFFGTGVLADLSQAEAWFRRAFEGGSQSGMLGYAGRLAARGDFETAETVLKVGVARDWAPALYWYYWCSVERSRSRATLLEMRPYLERAYALGSPLAQRSLSRRLSRGQFGLRAIPRGWRLILDFDERSKHKFLSAPEPSA